MAHRYAPALTQKFAANSRSQTSNLSPCPSARHHSARLGKAQRKMPSVARSRAKLFRCKTTSLRKQNHICGEKVVRGEQFWICCEQLSGVHTALGSSLSKHHRKSKLRYSRCNRFRKESNCTSGFSKKSLADDQIYCYFQKRTT